MKKFFFFLLALITGAGTMMASVPTTISEYSQEGITKGEAMSIPMTYLAFQVGCSSSSYIGVDMYAPSGKNYTIIGTSYTYWADNTFHTYQYFNPVSWCYSITTVANGYAFFDLQSVESGVWTLRSVQKYAGEWYYISAQEESNKEEVISEEAEKEETSADDATAVSIEEQVLYDENDIKITATGIEDGWLGTELKLLIENNTDQSITVQAKNANVNGYMVTTMMSADVAAGKKANDSF